MGVASVLAPTSRSIRWATPKQRQQFELGPVPGLASGGWGAAKTTGFVLKAIWLSTEFPKNRGVVARHVGKELRATTMSTFYKWCSPRLYAKERGGRRNDQNGYLKFAESQSEVLFLNLDDPETQGIIRGLEINWFLIDQAEENAEHMEEIFDMMLGRLGRWDIAEVPQYHIDAYKLDTGEDWPYKHPDSGNNVPPPYAMLTCNPDVETHWLYRRFHPESEEHQTLYAPQGYTFIDMPSLENQFLGDINKQFLLSRDAAFIRRNVDGIWGMPEGAIHAVDKLSIIPATPELVNHLVATCLLYRVADQGDTAPTCVLWVAVDQSGNVFFYREYYLGNTTVSVHRRNVYMLSKLPGSDQLERYSNELMDPAAFTKLPQKKGGKWAMTDEWADVTEYPRETAIFWQRADNNELGTRNRINEYLAVDPTRVHPVYKDLGSPRIFFLQANDRYPQGCIHAIKQTRGQRRVKIGTELGKPIFSDERDPGVVDHAYDPVRYLMASRPAVPAPGQTASDGTFFGAQQRLAALNRRRMGLR